MGIYFTTLEVNSTQQLVTLSVKNRFPLNAGVTWGWRVATQSIKWNFVCVGGGEGV